MQAQTASELSEPRVNSTTHSLHALMHFLRVVRSRQNIVFSAIAVAGLLGGLYFATATRYYQSKASLLVLQTGVDLNNTSMTTDGIRQGLMPTYERLFSSAIVLEGALNALAPDERQDLPSSSKEAAIQALRVNLSAATVRQTNIIEIGYKSKNPKASVSVVNAVLRSYLDFMDKTHKGTASEIINVLTKEKSQLDEKLKAKEQEVLAARKSFHDLGIRPGTNVLHPMVQRAITFNDALIAAQRKRLELQTTQAAIQSAIRNGEDLQQHVLTLENTVGREFFLSALGFGSRDVAIQSNLEKSQIEDQAQVRTLAEFFGPAHPRVLEVQQRIKLTQDYLENYQRKIEQKLSEMREHQLGPMLVQMVQQRLSEAWQHENSLRKSFEQARTEAVNMNGDLAKLEILEHDMKWLRDLHDVLLNQIANVDLKQDHADVRTAVVSEPVLPKSPIWPRLPIVALVSIGLGLAAGLGLIYVLDVLDDRFRSPEELRAELGAPVLAMVRQMDDLHAIGLEGIHCYVTPDAVTSEAFRTLRTTLAFASQDTSRIVITSPEPGDGKTTVLSNLAVSYAQAGKRTLLVDADMRRPGLSTLMGLKGQPGLSDFLVGSEPVDKAAAALVRATGLEGLDFLPAGLRRPNPAELLGGPRLAELLAWAEGVYDQVLVDSPPALAASDSSIIARLVDGVALVVHPKKNQRRLVMRAADSFTSVGQTLLGVVVNRVSADKSDAIYGYGVGYGYGYGYGYDRDAEAPETEAKSAAPVPETQPPTSPAPPAPPSPPAPPGIVPRRVA
jgi:polysaccharide biosynthesis transport protein